MKVLIAVDESECSKMAMESLVKRHWPANSEFRVISVFEPVANQCVGFGAAYVPVIMIETEKTLRKDRKEYLEQQKAELEKAFGKDHVSGAVLDGYAWRTIVNDAEHWGADLIVVGSHGRSGFSKFFLGSVAEGVAGHAHCSVEIIKGHALTDAEVA